jgi:hypothetical protein
MDLDEARDGLRQAGSKITDPPGSAHQPGVFPDTRAGRCGRLDRTVAPASPADRPGPTRPTIGPIPPYRQKCDRLSWPAELASKIY